MLIAATLFQPSSHLRICLARCAVMWPATGSISSGISGSTCRPLHTLSFFATMSQPSWMLAAETEMATQLDRQASPHRRGSQDRKGQHRQGPALQPRVPPVARRREAREHPARADRRDVAHLYLPRVRAADQERPPGDAGVPCEGPRGRPQARSRSPFRPCVRRDDQDLDRVPAAARAPSPRRLLKS